MTLQFKHATHFFFLASIHWFPIHVHFSFSLTWVAISPSRQQVRTWMGISWVKWYWPLLSVKPCRAVSLAEHKIMTLIYSVFLRRRLWLSSQDLFLVSSTYWSNCIYWCKFSCCGRYLKDFQHNNQNLKYRTQRQLQTCRGVHLSWMVI